MPYPVAHGLVGGSVVALILSTMPERRYYRNIFIGALLAVSPDMDYLLVWGFNLGEAWHRSITHSLLFAVAAGLICAALVNAATVKEAIAFVLSTASHGILDYAVTKKSAGVEILWPFSGHWFRLGLVDYTELNLLKPGLSLPGLVGDLKVIALETALGVLLLSFVIFLKQTVRHGREQDGSS